MPAKQWIWLCLGLMTGLGISQFWPHEPAFASATDRDGEKLGICTVNAGGVLGLGTTEAVFVIDFLTGKMTGALLNPQSQTFTNFYYRNVVTDFQLKPGTKPRLVVVSGIADMTSNVNVQYASGVIYVAEITSGKMIAYRFPINNARTAVAPVPLEPFAYFPFREAAVEK